MKNSVRLRIAAAIASFSVAFGAIAYGQTPAAFTFGGNVNERFHWLTPVALDETKTTWVRGFIPASEFMTGKRSFDSDEGILALRKAADSGHKVILSIKWDCTQKGEAGPVPAPGSAGEAKWFAFADQLLRATSGKVAILVVINELFVDTQPNDLAPGMDGQVPMVLFLQRLTAHLAAEHLLASDGSPLPIYTGGFTRLDFARNQDHIATKEMLQWANADPRIAGVDFHLHQPDLATSEQALRFMHKAVPHKPLMITEFSLVWKWKKHLPDQIGSGQEGKEFAKEHGISEKMTVADFLNQTFDHPVDEATWQQFLKSQAWFDPHYLDEIAPMMRANGVRVATYALTLNPLPETAGGALKPRRVTEDTVPWFLNDLLVPGLAVSPNPGREPQNYGFFQSYVASQQASSKR
jgi:hypothetical protein